MSPFRTLSLGPASRFQRVITGSALVLAAAVGATAAAAAVGGAAAGTPALAAPHTQLISPAAGAVKPAGQASSLDVVQVATLTATRTSAPTPREIAEGLLHRFGWRRYQFRFLNSLWSRESSWRVHAWNPYSGAYGIPQAVPGSKMGSAGPRWRTSARTQILWGLSYIKHRYGTPRRAWRHELATGWY